MPNELITADAFAPAAQPEPEIDTPEKARRAINKVFKLGRYKPGQSGNPGGMTKSVAAAKKLFRANAPELAQQFITLAFTAEDERVKAYCLNGCLGNAGIRPTEYDPKLDEPDGPQIDASRLSADEREQLRYLLTKAMTLPPNPFSDDPDAAQDNESYAEDAEASAEYAGARDFADSALEG